MALAQAYELLWLRRLSDVRTWGWVSAPYLLDRDASKHFCISFCYASKCNSSKKNPQYSGEKCNYIEVVWARCAKGPIPSLVCTLLSEIFPVMYFGCVWSRTESAICAVLGTWLLYRNPWNCKIKRNVVTGCGQSACVSCITSVTQPCL